MEEIAIYLIVLISAFFVLRKLFKKDGGCGCGEEGNCSKK